MAGQKLLEFGSEKPQLVSGDQVMKLLGLSRTTLWRLRANGLPHVKVRRLVRFNLEEVRAWLATLAAEDGDVVAASSDCDAASSPGAVGNVLPECHWSPSVALDPKHRPQDPRRPSSTVRREWWRFPQEAHLLDEEGARYRRLLAAEIGVLQGFPPDWGLGGGVSELDRIKGFGNAVPPHLAEVLFRQIQSFCDEPLRSVVEICAGFGGMALGVSNALGIKSHVLVDNWAPSIDVLRSSGVWGDADVQLADVATIDWKTYAGKVDLFCGGPPCQPWSNAGAGKGLRDDRDLLGLMPDVIAAVQPRVFLFENVPGLLQGENASYANWLIHRLRTPDEGTRYAVVAGVLNAADFGVPQVRRRVFIIGVRDAAVEDVHHLFDAIHRCRTHADPRAAIPEGKRPWVTLGEALPEWGDRKLPWRRWIHCGSSKVPQTVSQMTDSVPAATASQRSIQLAWPHRGTLPEWRDGRWHLVADRADTPLNRSLLPLIPRRGEGEGDPHRDPWYGVGDPLAVLDAFERVCSRQADLVYVDVPRIETDAVAFDAAEASARLDTWLTVTHSMLRRVVRLLDDRGVAVALCGLQESPYIQQMLCEALGPNNMVGVVAWQKGYSPRNMPGMKEVTPTHDNLLIFSKRMASLSPVHLLVPPDGFNNPDGDPRGAWNAEQKGANKPDCNYEVNVCPYRWEIVGGSGELPPGIWRINPKSGVIWAPEGAITEVGEWTFTVNVTDSAGASKRKEFTIAVSEEAEAPALATIPWLLAGADAAVTEPGYVKAGGALKFVTTKLPNARIGAAYSACVLASGGAPWVGTTRPGRSSASGGYTRYWEFPFKTLHEAAAVDKVDFKSTDTAIPSIKTYLNGATTKPLNQASVWLGRSKDGPSESLLRVVRAAQQIANREHATTISAAHIERACIDEGVVPSELTLREEASAFGAGLSSDAKKEVQDLVDRGLVPAHVLTNRASPSPLSISKPSALMARLLGLFTHANSLVVDIGSPAAELAAVAVAAGRRAIHVELPLSQPYREDLLLPRLRAASRGEHPMPHGVLFTDEPAPAEDNQSKSFFVRGTRREPCSEASVCVFELSKPLVDLDRDAATATLDYSAYSTGEPEFLDALSSLEGLVPLKSPRGVAFARTYGGVLAVYVPSPIFLDETAVRRVLAEVSDLEGGSERVRIYYHRGQQPSAVDGGVIIDYRMIPFELQIAAGCL